MQLHVVAFPALYQQFGIHIARIDKMNVWQQVLVLQTAVDVGDELVIVAVGWLVAT